MKKYLYLSLLLSLVANFLLIAYFLVYNDEKNRAGISTQSDELIQLEPSNTNIYTQSKDAFLEVNGVDDFQDFINSAGAPTMYFLSLAKSQDRDLWDKYTQYLYETSDVDMQQDDFEMKLDSFYNSDSVILEDGVSYLDLEIIFASNSIDSSVNLCESSFQGNSERVQSCIDNLYFYRTNSEDNYCNLISDSIKKSFCYSFYIK